MRTIIIRYQGGLGNQMFEYATKLCIKKRGDFVKDDVSFYYDNPTFMPLVINDIFSNVSIKNFVEPVWITKFLRKIYQYMNKYFLEKDFVYFDPNMFDKSGWYEGYWQSYKYYEQNRDNILSAFNFPSITIDNIRLLEEQILNSNSISIHIRGQDYLNNVNSSVYGGICTKKYYTKAIEYIKNCVENPVFYLFSDDVMWARSVFSDDNIVYVNHENDEYQDWMDMYLMSRCKHNIIANSSFSWWGAWLNRNPQKLVIAPSLWCNTYSCDEVCPSEWIRI